MTAREAKQYLIERIVSSAKANGILLSDTEREMLSFTESDPTAEMLAANEEFEANYDQAEFERKIGRAIRNLRQRATPDEQQRWNRALTALRGEDHYVLALVNAAGAPRPRGDLLKLLLTAIAIAAVFSAVVYILASRR